MPRTKASPKKTQSVKVKVNRYLCPIKGCRKRFYTPSLLARHHRIHTGELPYICHWEKCGEPFNQYSNMMSHIKSIHKRIRSDPCSFCGKTRSNDSNLRHHELLHLNPHSRYYLPHATCVPKRPRRKRTVVDRPPSDSKRAASKRKGKIGRSVESPGSVGLPCNPGYPTLTVELNCHAEEHGTPSLVATEPSTFDMITGSCAGERSSTSASSSCFTLRPASFPSPSISIASVSPQVLATPVLEKHLTVSSTPLAQSQFLPLFDRGLPDGNVVNSNPFPHFAESLNLHDSWPVNELQHSECCRLTLGKNHIQTGFQSRSEEQWASYGQPYHGTSGPSSTALNKMSLNFLLF